MRQGDSLSDVGFVLRREGGRTFLEVSILSTGKGANYRKWEPENPFILLNSERVAPFKREKFYAAQESIASSTAPVIFAAIGSQYERDAVTAQNSSGTACSSTAHTQATAQNNQSGFSKAIDRAGMAAGMGLLASQAKGEITGLRASFDITGRETQLRNKTLLKFSTINRAGRQPLEENVTVPVRLAD